MESVIRKVITSSCSLYGWTLMSYYYGCYEIFFLNQDTADIIKIISPDYDPDLRASPDPIARRNTKQNTSMLKIC